MAARPGGGAPEGNEQRHGLARERFHKMIGADGQTPESQSLMSNRLAIFPGSPGVTTRRGALPSAHDGRRGDDEGTQASTSASRSNSRPSRAFARTPVRSGRPRRGDPSGAGCFVTAEASSRGDDERVGELLRAAHAARERQNTRE